MSLDERVISLAPVRHPSSGAVPQPPGSLEKMPRGPTLNELLGMCVSLLRENGGMVPVVEMQQRLQTRFHVSARLADYGAPSMKDLILQCPDIRVRRGRWREGESTRE